MNKKITREDLDAMLKTEQEIWSLPGTAPVTDHEPLSSTEEFKLAEEGHGHAMVMIIESCTSVGALCEHHADEWLGDYFRERALRLEGHEDQLSMCDDCGKAAIDCMKIRALKPEFLGMIS